MKLVGWNCPNESRAPHKLLAFLKRHVQYFPGPKEVMVASGKDMGLPNVGMKRAVVSILCILCILWLFEFYTYLPFWFWHVSLE